MTTWTEIPAHVFEQRVRDGCKPLLTWEECLTGLDEWPALEALEIPIIFQPPKGHRDKWSVGVAQSTEKLGGLDGLSYDAAILAAEHYLRESTKVLHQSIYDEVERLRKLLPNN